MRKDVLHFIVEFPSCLFGGSVVERLVSMGSSDVKSATFCKSKLIFHLEVEAAKLKRRSKYMNNASGEVITQVSSAGISRED